MSSRIRQTQVYKKAPSSKPDANLEYWNDTVGKRPAKMHYLTVATKPHPVLTALQNRASTINETITVLGSDHNKTIGWATGGNFGIKLREMVIFLKNQWLDPMDIILFTDAYDVAYVGTEALVVEAFSQFSKPVVFGAEKLCSPDASLADRYPPLEAGREFRYLNSGGYIGRVWALRKLMSDYVYVDIIEDQAYWIDKFLNNQDLIELDYANKLFLNCVNVDKKEIIWDGARVYYSDAMPLVIHANGSDKSYINPLIGFE